MERSTWPWICFCKPCFREDNSNHWCVLLIRQLLYIDNLLLTYCTKKYCFAFSEIQRIVLFKIMLIYPTPTITTPVTHCNYFLNIIEISPMKTRNENERLELKSIQKQTFEYQQFLFLSTLLVQFVEWFSKKLSRSFLWRN